MNEEVREKSMKDRHRHSAMKEFEGGVVSEGLNTEHRTLNTENRGLGLGVLLRRAVRELQRVGLALLLLGLVGCSFFNPMPATVPVYHGSAEGGTLEAGAAVVDITPHTDLWLGGYGMMRTSQGVHDSLYARAVVLKRGELEMALVAVDLVGIQRQHILEIQEELDGLDPRHVVIASTHNHSAPDTLGLWGFPPFVTGIDSDYLSTVKAGILEALRLARANLRPAEVGFGAIQAEAEGLLDNLRRPGVVDREVVVLHVREVGGGATIATVTELGCHPEVMSSSNKKITSDFPHWTLSRLQKQLGGVGIYVSGALGGLVTPDVERSEPRDEEQEWAEAERVGNLLADYTLEVVSAIEHYDSGPQMAVWHAPLYLANRNHLYEVVRWTGVLDRDRYRWGYLLTEVNLWQIGAFRMATVPGEITPDLGLRIKKTSGGRPTMLVGLANDELGYLLPESEYALPLYSYERGLCPGYDSATRIVRRLEDVALLMENTE
jgi:hypothetical protein